MSASLLAARRGWFVERNAQDVVITRDLRVDDGSGGMHKTGTTVVTVHCSLVKASGDMLAQYGLASTGPIDVSNAWILVATPDQPGLNPEPGNRDEFDAREGHFRVMEVRELDFGGAYGISARLERVA
jgi:hypothetical protein